MSEEATQSRDSGEVLFEAICDRQQYFVALFSFAVVFFLLQAPYLFVADPESTLYVVAVLNIVGTSVFAVSFGVVLWFCSQRN